MKVLIVVDMQNDFVDGTLGSQRALDIVPNVVQKIREFDGEILLTKDTHDQAYLSTQEGQQLPVPHCIYHSEGWALNPDVEEAINQRTSEGVASKAFLKAAFGSTQLSHYLAQLSQQKKIDEIVLIGLCTDICVISNAILVKATLPEVKITVDAACCAGVTPESHENALKAMRQCQIFIENWDNK